MTEDSRSQLRDRFAANLKRARKASGLSQKELALSCDLHRTEISLLERGGREPRLGTLLKLAEALDISAEELSAGIRWEPRKRRFKVNGQ
jgi:transcriptional regulator with XRE-family HTH domain